MKKTLLSVVWPGLLVAVAACQKTEAPAPVVSSPAAPALLSGIEEQYIDKSTRPQDDFFKYVNGKWLESTEIPADRSNWGSFAKLNEDTQQQLKALIEEASKNVGEDPDKQKIRDLYNSFMDEATLEKLGAKPAEAEFARIDGLKSIKDLPAEFARLAQTGVNVPFVPYVHQDAKESTKYVLDLYQAGLGLPDRDYYVKDDDKLEVAREKYQAYVEKMLAMVGDKNAKKSAVEILKLETELAKVHWSKVENRDPVKAYNKYPLSALPGLAPGYDWKAYLSAAGVEGKIDYLIVSQPTYITGLAKIVSNTPLPVWKTYLKWQVLDGVAPYLSKAFVDEHFAFHGTVLSGVPEIRPRWKRGVDAVENAIGEGLGKLYVAKYFPPENKARMDALVSNLMAAYKASIDTLDWMSEATKEKARAKLAKFTPKIGYPGEWRDYSSLTIQQDDLLGNVTRAQVFEYKRNINKLGQPIDRNEWGMTPQTINAYYNPEKNEIVFPAGILQPPFFNVKADDAVNYGAIGAVIGHEISHGFDDEGSQYDGDGILGNWFTEKDLENFKARAAVLIDQYGAYEPLPGRKINGKLTLGENIADNSGLAIAYKAYKISLGGKDAAVIGGLSGDQRFYMGFAQVWRSKTREAEVLRRLTVDPHSPPMFRVLGTVKNQPAFYSAFDIKEADSMYLAADKRFSLW